MPVTVWSYCIELLYHESYCIELLYRATVWSYCMELLYRAAVELLYAGLGARPIATVLTYRATIFSYYTVYIGLSAHPIECRRCASTS